MPTAPTLSAITDAGGYLLVPYVNSGSGDSNYLERSAPDEYAGAYIKLANPLAWSLTTAWFRDYSVASGKTYTYRMTGVQGAVTAASATQSGSLTLSSAWLHSVAVGIVADGPVLLLEDGGGLLLEDGGALELEGVITANAALVLQLRDKAPQQRAYSLESNSRVAVNSSLPIVSIGSVQKLQISPAAISVYGGTDRATLRSIYRSSNYSCLRDTLGNKWMGRLLPPTESYGATFAELGLVFEQLDYNEAVL